jgi:DNA-directed RNA polymerase subunit RPC12/RpoP
MAVAKIVCPECKKSFKGREDLAGKRIRCPGCGASFVVGKVSAEDEAAALLMSGDGGATQPPRPVEDEDNPNPYGVQTVAIGPRCPSCANEMVSEDAVIRLFCGYNVQTRRTGETRKVKARTGGDWAGWITPGIACAVGILLLALNQIIWIFWLGSMAAGTDAFIWNVGSSEAWRWWMTVLILGIIWGLGRFAFKRLIVEPTPPEVELD